MRDKLGRFVKGYSANPQTQFKKGNKGFWLGKKRAPFSEEWKKKLSHKAWDKDTKGLMPPVWNKGLQLDYIPHYGHRGKLIGDKNPAWKGGLPKCRICNKQLGVRTATYCQNCANKLYHSGKNNINWKGGITPINMKIRKSAEYRRWRKAVLKRDNYKCIWCSSTEDLEVDHIKPFAFYPKLRTELSNGRTLCLSCHQKTFIFYQNQFVIRKVVMRSDN